MILDRLAQSAKYRSMHPGFAAAFDYLARADVSALPAGRHELDGARLAVVINRDAGRGQGGAVLEAHRQYIDIQVTLAGAEVIGWQALSECREPKSEFDSSRDMVLFNDRPESWFAVPPGSFTIFFPADAHAPLAGEGSLHKAVFKVAVDWGSA